MWLSPPCERLAASCGSNSQEVWIRLKVCFYRGRFRFDQKDETFREIRGSRFSEADTEDGAPRAHVGLASQFLPVWAETIGSALPIRRGLSAILTLAEGIQDELDPVGYTQLLEDPVDVGGK